MSTLGRRASPGRRGRRWRRPAVNGSAARNARRSHCSARPPWLGSTSGSTGRCDTICTAARRTRSRSGSTPSARARCDRCGGHHAELVGAAGDRGDEGGDGGGDEERRACAWRGSRAGGTGRELQGHGGRGGAAERRDAGLVGQGVAGASAGRRARAAGWRRPPPPGGRATGRRSRARRSPPTPRWCRRGRRRRWRSARRHGRPRRRPGRWARPRSSPEHGCRLRARSDGRRLRRCSCRSACVAIVPVLRRGRWCAQVYPLEAAATRGATGQASAPRTTCVPPDRGVRRPGRRAGRAPCRGCPGRRWRPRPSAT